MEAIRTGGDPQITQIVQKEKQEKGWQLREGLPLVSDEPISQLIYQSVESA